MKRTKVIVRNTLMLYCRSVLTLGLTLLSSRWVLHALGESDYGLFSMVGSLVVFVTFMNAVLANSVARHLSFAIGEGDPVQVRKWFNTACGLHLVLATALTLTGWFAGSFLITRFLNIPADRLAAACWVLRFSLIAAFFSMISVPFVGMFTAKQEIGEVAFLGIVQAVLGLLVAFGVGLWDGDRLIAYAAAMAAAIATVQVLLVLRAARRFAECASLPGEWFHRRRTWAIASFATWNVFGNLGMTLKDQGTAVLLNLQFGPRVNAAYGIAIQVSSAASQFSQSLMGALAPEVTASEGRGDRGRVIALARLVNRYGTILVLLFVVPLCLETEYVLELWLRNPPRFAAMFCRLVLAGFAIDRLSSGYMLAVSARGVIAAYQATVGSLIILTLPLAWAFLRAGAPPPGACYAFVITMIFCSVARTLWARRMFTESIGGWVRSTVMPALFVAGGAAGAGFCCRWLLPESFLRLVVTIVVTTGAVLALTWSSVASGPERVCLRGLWALFIARGRVAAATAAPERKDLS